MNKGYYVTVIRDKKIGWLLGPFVDHGKAISLIDNVRELACKIDCWCDFDSFGTASIETNKELPKGKLNNLMWF